MYCMIVGKENFHYKFQSSILNSSQDINVFFPPGRRTVILSYRVALLLIMTDKDFCKSTSKSYICVTLVITFLNSNLVNINNVIKYHQFDDMSFMTIYIQCHLVAIQNQNPNSLSKSFSMFLNFILLFSCTKMSFAYIFVTW